MKLSSDVQKYASYIDGESNGNDFLCRVVQKNSVHYGLGLEMVRSLEVFFELNLFSIVLNFTVF